MFPLGGITHSHIHARGSWDPRRDRTGSDVQRLRFGAPPPSSGYVQNLTFVKCTAGVTVGTDINLWKVMSVWKVVDLQHIVTHVQDVPKVKIVPYAYFVPFGKSNARHKKSPRPNLDD